MSDIKESQKKNQSAQREYIRRKARYLKAEIDCLTSHDIKVLVQHCSSELEDERNVLILANLITGRSFDDLLNPELVYSKCANHNGESTISLLGRKNGLLINV